MLDAKYLDATHPGQPITAAFNDLEIENYDIVTISGTARKTQDVIKALVTTKGSNLAYPNYGSDFSKSIGARAADTVNNGDISDSISEAMGYLKRMETSTDPHEQLRRVSASINLTSQPQERQVNLVVETVAGDVIKTNLLVN